MLATRSATAAASPNGMATKRPRPAAFAPRSAPVGRWHSAATPIAQDDLPGSHRELSGPSVELPKPATLPARSGSGGGPERRSRSGRDAGDDIEADAAQ